MSLFARIKDAIFGHKTGESTRATATPASNATTGAPRQPTAGASQAGIPASPTDAKWESTADRDVDVELVLESMASKNPQQLNWRTSIVDLLKLLDMDSSLAARKELAQELGCPADLMGDSAQMNMWLHKAVLKRVADNGGKVPKELLN